MAKLSRPQASRQILVREPAPPQTRWRGMAVVVLAIAALAALAWIDGGEEPLHPIVQPVELPGVGQ